MTDTNNTELLAQFKQYLEHNNAQSFPFEGQPDLHTILRELVELKTEIKAQSRQFKNTLDTLSSALDTAQNDNKVQVEKLAESDLQHTEIMRTMLLGFIEIYDRLVVGLETLQSYQPVNSLFSHSKKKDVQFIKRFDQGQQMTVKRFESLLEQQHIIMIDCLGKPFDPATMRAVEVVSIPHIKDRQVVEELRKGFLYQGQKLRLADVVVNRYD